MVASGGFSTTSLHNPFTDAPPPQKISERGIELKAPPLPVLNLEVFLFIYFLQLDLG